MFSWNDPSNNQMLDANNMRNIMSQKMRYGDGPYSLSSLIQWHVVCIPFAGNSTEFHKLWALQILKPWQNFKLACKVGFNSYWVSGIPSSGAIILRSWIILWSKRVMIKQSSVSFDHGNLFFLLPLIQKADPLSALKPCNIHYVTVIC